MRRGAALANGEREVVPRVSDLDALAASTSGKIEIEMLDDGRDSQVLDRIIKSAVLEVFRARVKPEMLGPVVASFEDGSVVHTGEDVPAAEYRKLVDQIEGLKPLLAKPRRRRVAGGVRLGHRVRARGPAPHQAPQQGRRSGAGPPTGRAARAAGPPGYRALMARGSSTRAGTARRSGSTSTPTRCWRR